MWTVLRLSFFTWVFLLDIVPSCTEACEPGWFGSGCQYKCHCEPAENSCDNNGTCIGRSGCQPRWFGPACQYVDLAPNSSVTLNTGNTAQLTDGNDGTCTTDQASQTVNMTWTEAFPFTWMRIVVSDSDLLYKIKVEFMNNRTIISPLKCINATVNNKTLDIHCDLSETVQQVTLTGEGIKSLCSLYISGGRNVALKQEASQSSTYADWDADRAVDGKTSGDEDNAKLYCSSTKTQAEGDPPESWNVTFLRLYMVNRYVLYNRETQMYRLKGFILTSSDKDDKVVFNYTDTEATAQPIYTVISAPAGQVVSGVQVNATRQNIPDRNPVASELILTLCEVEIFGDAICDAGNYGRECEHTCKCEVQEACFVSTGGCPSGCAAGFYGNGCQEECPPKFYGVDCRKNCSTNCSDETCDRVDGRCNSCIPGKAGDHCDKDCQKGFYGIGCNDSCGQNCGDDRTCAGQSGKCSKGCQPGYTGEFCNATCPVNTYGSECAKNCNTACVVNNTLEKLSTCHHVTGKCLYGCKEGTTCPSADEISDEDEDEDSLPIPLIAGLVAAAVVLILLIFLGVIFWRRRNNSKSPRGQRSKGDGADSSLQKSKEPAHSQHTSSETENSENTRGGPYYNTVAGQSGAHTIAVKDLGAFITSHNEKYIKDEYATIPNINQGATMTAANSEENRAKNRYKNINAYDHSRVHLNINEAKNEGDYINASYIEGYKKEEKFIASQGPNETTLNDFIRMLWEQKVDKVVMLTNLIEEGKTKCEQYWPEDGELEFGEIKVQLTTTQVFADYTIRKLILAMKGEQDHPLTHFHFTSWPDRGSPTTPWGLVDFEQRVASYPTDRPIVVHCSAGVGRTGTFIALRNVVREAEDTGYVDFYSTLVKLRQDRVNMIQTADQYIFLHKAALVALICMGTTVTSNNINDRINFLQKTSSSGFINMDREFQAICNACAATDQANDEVESGDGVVSSVYVNSGSATNQAKNRFSDILPKESYRPHLMCNTKNMDNYINAVLVPSFTRPRHHILTQLPLPATVLDFWRLVTQYRVSLIVAFEVDSTSTDSTVGDYMPFSEVETLSCGPFSIETGPANPGSLWIQQKLTITTEETGTSSLPLVEEHHLNHLKVSSTSLDPKTLLAVVEQVRSQSSSSQGKTIFMCRNGATYSGLVYVLSLLLDRMDNDLCLTIPLVVGAVKAIRPQVIPTVEQYRALYGVLKHYHEAANVYCNFGDSIKAQSSVRSMSTLMPKPMSADSTDMSELDDSLLTEDASFNVYMNNETVIGKM